MPLTPKIIKPPHVLATKVGSGGLPDYVVERADNAMQKINFDIKPVVIVELDYISRALAPMSKHHIDITRENREELVTHAMMIRAHAGMFHYHFIYEVADDLVFTLNYIDQMNDDAAELIRLQLKVLQRVIDHATPHELSTEEHAVIAEIDKAIMRYCKRYPKAKSHQPA